MPDQTFELRAPSNQTMIDLFPGGWATDFDQALGVVGTGRSDLLHDGRMDLAAATLGHANRFDGYKVLELGPLEAAHSHCLEQLGAASVTAIDSNSTAFLKCLLVKEMLRLRTRFLFGDAVTFLRQSDETFDLIFCVGVLYHLADPLELIKQICLHTQRCFVWSHYYHEPAAAIEGARTARRVDWNGFQTTYYERDYPTMQGASFLGGNRPTTAWMTQPDITRAFRHFGMAKAEITGDQTDYHLGAHFSCAYSRVV